MGFRGAVMVVQPPAWAMSFSVGKAKPCSKAASARASTTRFGANNSSTWRRSSQRANCPASRRISSGGTTRVLPNASVERISCADTSKLKAVNCATRVPAGPGKAASCHSSRLSKAPAGITTPLGMPVEPEV